MPQWVTILWAVLLILGALSSAVAKNLDNELKPTTWPWVHEPKTQLWISLPFAVVVAADSIRRIISHLGSSKETSLRHQVRKQLSTAIAAVSDEAGVKVGELGCGLFLAHRSWRHGLRLKRVERVRLLDNVSESGVVFRPGVGTVGNSWETRNPAHHDWTAINSRFAENLPERQAWEKTKTETKHGFDYESWRTMVGRYAEVLAVPVTVGKDLIGILAIDLKWHEGMSTGTPRLNQSKVKAALGTIARTLEPILSNGR